MFMILKFLLLFIAVFLFRFSFLFFLFLSFFPFFLLFFQLLHGFCWLSRPLLGFLELSSIMSEFSCYCQSYDRNSVQCLMHVIDLHLLLGAGEGSGDGMIAVIHCAVAHWRFLNLHVTVNFVQNCSSVLVLLLGFWSLGLESLFSLICWYVVRSGTPTTLSLGYLSILSRLT
jgi:hypothetical protein